MLTVNHRIHLPSPCRSKRTDILLSKEGSDRFKTGWVSILLGEGKDSKQLSAAEEENLLEFVSKLQWDYHRGYITPKELREHAGMGDTPSEVVLDSQILKRWTEQKKVKKVEEGRLPICEEVRCGLGGT